MHFDDPMSADEAIVLSSNMSSFFDKVDRPKEMDVAQWTNEDGTTHLGLVVDGRKILHATTRGVIVTRARCLSKECRFYRYNGGVQ